MSISNLEAHRLSQAARADPFLIVTVTVSRLPDGREAIAVGYRPAGVDFPPADIETYLRAAADSVAGPGLLERPWP